LRLKALFAAANSSKSSGLPQRFAARKSSLSMVKSIILKDALSYWNFSNLWSIAGIKKGSGKSIVLSHLLGQKKVRWAIVSHN
jgi:hypothetical protein